MKIDMWKSAVLIFMFGIFCISLSVGHAQADKVSAKSGLWECKPSKTDACANIVYLPQGATPPVEGGNGVLNKSESHKTMDNEVPSMEPSVDGSLKLGNKATAGLGLDAATEGQSLATGKFVMSVKVQNYYVATVNWKLFAKRVGGVYTWPGPGYAYVVNAGYALTVKINCNYGEKIFLGATSSSGLKSWGVGLNGTRYCVAASCYHTCTRASVIWSLR